jgi:hypothetical protein
LLLLSLLLLGSPGWHDAEAAGVRDGLAQVLVLVRGCAVMNIAA